eukprot:1546637-Rhodomonas_salina.1
MEGIELEAEGSEEVCARGDVKYEYFDPLMLRSIAVCLRYFDPSTTRFIIVVLLLVLRVLYWYSREYLDDNDLRLAIYYHHGSRTRDPERG